MTAAQKLAHSLIPCTCGPAWIERDMHASECRNEEAMELVDAVINRCAEEAESGSCVVSTGRPCKCSDCEIRQDAASRIRALMTEET